MRYCAKIFFLLCFFSASIIFPQIRSEGLKRQAQLLMQDGRYGEAIDQLHKFISSNPQLAVGYHLRGLCYEKTTQYQYSVLDLRRARRLEPGNVEIQKDLSRVIAVWHKSLYQKIEGHKRDIAIDPNNPFSYLEIGKSYRWLEEWNSAENWYDEYLKRDDNASPDEIIRYTEILAKTGSITKGEKILKLYVERYPNDWRLWSRYGYFTLWLGKFKIAEDAFMRALNFKPFFKEAEDGLDLARNQAYMLQYQPRAFERVYPIDRYYALLKKEPDNDRVRFDLAEELVKADRWEEAFQQLQMLRTKFSEDERFKSLFKTVTDYRDSTFNKQIEEYTEIIKSNPDDKDAVIKLAEAYGNLFFFDSAIEVLKEYLQNKPEDKETDVRFLYAKYLAWNYEWENSIAELNKLLAIDPDNLDYQLLRGQIAVWTVLDFDIAEKYLLNVAEKRPDSIDPLIALSSMYAWQKKFDESKKYLDRAKEIAPNTPEVENAESNYALHLSAYEEQKVLELKAEAERLAIDGNCPEARLKYEEYAAQRRALSRNEIIEYADILSCAQDFKKAIEIYDELLSAEFDYNIALQRAKNYFYNGDSLTALTELQNLNKLRPEDEAAKIFLADAYGATAQPEIAEGIYREIKAATSDSNRIKEINQRLVVLGEYYIRNKKNEKADELYEELLEETTDTSLINDIRLRQIYLADSYALNDEWGRAEDLYDELLELAKDTSEVRMLKERLSWVPPSAFSRGVSIIGTYLVPTNIGLAPFSNYFRDNQDLALWSYGMRIDAGFAGFLGLGGVWTKSRFNTSVFDPEFTSLKGVATVFFSGIASLSASYGILDILGEKNKQVGDITLRFEEPKIYSVNAYYENNDARLLLYSPTMVFTRLKSELYRLTAFYQHRDFLRLSGFYSFYDLSDGNLGNDLQIRLGKQFFKDGMFGYEYYFSDWKFISQFYYSPQDFSSHSIWSEWYWSLEKELFGKLGGKIGYVPDVDFVIGEAFFEVNLKPVKALILLGRIGYTSSYRYTYAYNSFTASVSAYWSLY